MKDEEFLTLMEAEHGASNRLNRAVNLRTGIDIQQEVTESCSKQEVSILPEVGERKPETSKKTCYQKSTNQIREEKSKEDNSSLLDTIQAVRMERQEEKNKQNYADFRIIPEVLLMNQGERKLENKNFNKSMLPEEQEPSQEPIL